MKSVVLAAALTVIALAGPVWAQTGRDPASTAAPARHAAGDLNTGEVRRVSKETSRITIAHGPLKSFDMPAMTMAFPVKDASLLGKVKQGDKVTFVLEKSGEDLVITRIDPVR